jgi:hypothetical protein
MNEFERSAGTWEVTTERAATNCTRALSSRRCFAAVVRLQNFPLFAGNADERCQQGTKNSICELI